MFAEWNFGHDYRLTTINDGLENMHSNLSIRNDLLKS